MYNIKINNNIVLTQLIFIFILLTLNSCSLKTLGNVKDLSEVSNDEIIVVGKVSLNPPMGKDEQILGAYYENNRNRVALMTDKNIVVKEGESISDFDNSISAELKKTFYVKTRMKSFYIVNGIITMKVKGGVWEKAPLPVVFKINNNKDARAIYIGHIKYYRDEFFQITKVKIINEYNKEKKQFSKKFGNGIKLQKSLAVVVN